MTTLPSVLWTLIVSLAMCAPALGQVADLPAAPAPVAPAKTAPGSIFTVPPADLRVPEKSASLPADAPPEVCFAPAEGLYAPGPKPSSQFEEASHRYVSLAAQNMRIMWERVMPRAANDPWLKGAQVVVRFAILPDGSTDTPRVTVSSGRASYDKAALEAVYKTPFAPLPAGIAPALPICMHFRYNMNEEPYKKPLDLWPPPAKPAS